MINKKIIPVSNPVITDNDAKYVYKVTKSGWVSSSGKEINLFEKKLSKLVNRKYACAVSSGTAALEIAVKSLNLKKNDEIIMPTFTIISNAISIIKNHAKPVLIDSDINSWNINIDNIKKKITKKTKALMIPHIYGFPCEMDKILNICKKYKLYLIEDAAEMIGQTYNNKPCGSFGDISTFSFYANKHITTGEGGMIFTNNKDYYKKFNSFKNLSFGKKDRFNHSDISWNYRITNMQAALGVSQVNRLNKIIKKKKEIGKFYYEKFKNNKNLIIQPIKFDYAENIFWIYGIVLKKGSKKNRQEIQKRLLRSNIDTRPFFWPMHKQDIFKKMGFFKKEKHPVSEFLSNNGFYIPSGIDLCYKKLNYIADTINKLTSK
jgi:perosamine synthetase